MRNSTNGEFELYDIAGNQLTGAQDIGNVGTSWTVVGFGDFSGNANETDMLMRDSSSGAFEVYDIAHNALTGAAALGDVGTSWTVTGIAAQPAGTQGASNDQLVQAMAAFAPAGGALDTSLPLGPTPPSAPSLLAGAVGPSRPV